MVLVDLRRVEDCFAAIDYFEDRGLPFVVAVNGFPGADEFPVGGVREALELHPGVPIDQASGLKTLIALVEHALMRASSVPAPG